MRRRRRHGPCDRELGAWEQRLGGGGSAGSDGSLTMLGGSGGDMMEERGI